jgi:hypothetical protein
MHICKANSGIFEKSDSINREVVELYASILREEHSRGIELQPDDPFFESDNGDSSQP